MTAIQHGRIWKWIQNNLEIYRNLTGRYDIYVSGTKKIIYRFVPLSTPLLAVVSRQLESLVWGIFSVPVFNSSFFLLFSCRFYFKTEIEGEAYYEEETEVSSLVPLWRDQVQVQCMLLE